MFWSFFHSANAAPGTPRDARTPNNATPRSHQPLITENAPPLALPPSSVAGTSTSVGGHHNNHAPHHSSVPTTSNQLPRSIPAPPPTTTMSAVSSTAGTPVAGTPEERHLIHGAGTPAPSTPDILEGSPVASPTGNASFSSASNLLPFHVSNTATNNGGGVEVPPINLSFLQRHPSTTSLHALPRAPLDPLALHLGRVNEAALGAKAMLSSKYASYPLPSEAAKAAALESRSKSLSELLRDPEWAPGRPTRPSQIGDYCAHHKLKFDSVIRERMKPSRHKIAFRASA
ncbi:Hypothetical protein, putative [Bodo saltans]|uniref:Uncharacterized protein n=1 Tax=Bodo saltans TaxID=75058 RepID=A0A0S4IWJ8_BODSA|nr:Hypothetical protein, putative [Bodo saltans]|eukprot:CUG06235.1 Hypothetical protein, putative [Bodo saltans]